MTFTSSRTILTVACSSFIFILFENIIWGFIEKIKYLSPQLVISKEDRHSWMDGRFIGGKSQEAIL